jgi:hypothetical protein
MREKFISNDNLLYYSMMHKIFILQSIFFALPNYIKTKHLNEWSILKTEINKYAAQYIHNELDDSNENNVILSILSKFNNFWKSTLSIYGDNYKTPIDFAKSRVKRPFSDEHNKKILFEAILFFEEPKTDFSSEFTDMWIDHKTPEWLAKDNVLSQSINQSFYAQTKKALINMFKSNTDKQPSHKMGPK